MGNRSWVYVISPGATEEFGNCVAESNNNAPFGWFAFTPRAELIRYLGDFSAWYRQAIVADENDELDDFPDPPTCQVPVKEALAHAEPYLERPGITDMAEVIKTHAAAIGDDAMLLVDWSQYNDFFEETSEFASDLLKLADGFAAGENGDTEFEQIGELHSDKPSKTEQYSTKTASQQPTAEKKSKKPRPAFMDSEWFIWVLAIVSAVGALIVWFLTQSVLLSLLVLVVLTVGLAWATS